MNSLPLGRQLARRKPLARATAAEHSDQQLTRSLSTLQLTMFGVGSTVGTGIFFVMQESVPKAGPAVVLSFLIAGITAGLSALCYAEMASSIPVSGSTYSYAYHSIGELMAIIIAACVLLEYGVSASAVAVGWSGYFNDLLQGTLGFHLPDALSFSPIPVFDDAGVQDPHGLINLPAVILVLLCMLLLIRGASESAKVNTIMVFIKLAVLLMFAVIAFTAFQADHFSNFLGAGWGGVAGAAGTIFFSFIGLDAVATAGEEVKNPQRALPVALVGALFIVIGVYLLVAFAALGSQPTEDFSDPEQQTAGLAVILRHITGAGWPSVILSAGAVISVFSVTLVTLYGQTRILFAISRDGFLPERFSRVNPRTLTPDFNTVVVAIVVALIAGFVPSHYLWDVVSIGTLMAFIVVSMSVIIMRVREPDLPRPFKVPGYPVTPVLSIAACIYVLYGLAPVTWVVFAVWLAVVLAFYLAYGRSRAALNRAAAAEPEGA